MRNKLKVVIDTNIFIRSWFGENEACDKIMELVDNNKIILFFSQDSVGELIYVVKKFAIKNMSSQIPRIKILHQVTEIFYKSKSVDTRNIECPNISDEYDKMFLECAMKGNVEYLISDDFKSGMHDLKNIKFKILNSQDFIDDYDNYSI